MYKYMKNPLIIGKPSTGHIILISLCACKCVYFMEFCLIQTQMISKC